MFGCGHGLLRLLCWAVVLARCLWQNIRRWACNSDRTLNDASPPQWCTSAKCSSQSHAHPDRYFNLVIVHGDAEKPGRVLLRWLEEELDGLFRLAPGVYEEKRAALLPVRTQWMHAQGRRKGGFKLLTLRSRILNTELVD